jgi:4-amino-4-deoxy-L-arabinose transferase-like glycosyltransferase
VPDPLSIPARTSTGRWRLAHIERLLAALADPTQRERAALAVVLAYVAVWTVYGTIAKGSQDIHADMSELFALSRGLAWGYAKHPPLAMVVVRVWFMVFPTTDWAYYLLAMTTAGVALWIAWRLCERFLDGDKCAVGLALLTLVPFFNFHALKYNQNTILMPLWAATTLFFLRAFETRRLLDAALAGAGAAACMYGKYWSIFLIAGLGVAALVDSRRAAYFRSPAPWVTIMVGALTLAPHIVWLIANDFLPFSYAMTVHGAASFTSSLIAAIRYLAGSASYIAVPLVILFAVLRPTRVAVEDIAWPTTPERRLAAVAFWATLVLPPIVAVFTHVELTALWSMSAWTLLPVLLLSSPLVTVSRRDATRVVALAATFPFVMVAIAPAVAFATHRMGLPPGATHSSVLVEPVERLWRQTTNRPLQMFGGFDEFTDGVSFYLRDHPFAAHVLDAGVSQGIEERIGREGIALLCPARPREPASAAACRNAAVSLAGRFPSGKREEIDVSRRYIGVDGEPERYLIITIPPRP